MIGRDRTPDALLVWGGSGHAKVLEPIILSAGRSIAAAVERRPEIANPFAQAARFFGEDDVAAWLSAPGAAAAYVLAIGGEHGAERLRLAAWLDGFGLEAFTALHPRAFIADTARIGAGCHVLAMAAVCEEVVLGRQTIVNTGATVDHECRIGAGVHIMPGATIAGCVIVEDHATIGSNATVLPNLVIGAGARIGAGAVVTRDVAAGTTMVGNPARPRA